MSLLWLSYGFLSLVVVLTGYLGLGFLPRLPRLVITWLVAGMIWVPARFRLPLLDEGEFYTGFAPAVMVAAVAFLERNASVMVPALLLLVAGGLAGAGVGLLLWWRGRHHHEYVDMDEDDEPMPPRRGGGGERREPMIG
ncbi:hypothetical protein [Halomonas kalidii]|uniref:hypothetical protein n=1 Tax=Halomonas kalidii TaxID=3043293 RepID=UPI002DD623AC|nr:hypothetical protein [Halomonas kalidii]